jgi:hypothetical protein
VDVGDVLDSVLWGERGDDDDICDGISSMGVSTDVREIRFVHVLVQRRCRSDNDKGNRA